METGEAADLVQRLLISAYPAGRASETAVDELVRLVARYDAESAAEALDKVRQSSPWFPTYKAVSDALNARSDLSVLNSYRRSETEVLESLLVLRQAADPNYTWGQVVADRLAAISDYYREATERGFSTVADLAMRQRVLGEMADQRGWSPES